MINKNALLGFSLILFHKASGERGKSLRKRASMSYRDRDLESQRGRAVIQSYISVMEGLV